MNKKGFTLIEIIICLVLLSIIATTFIISLNKNKKNNSITYTSLEKNILNAADVLVNMNKDDNNNNYAEQLNLGAQGVEIKLTKLINEGLLDDNIIDKLVKEQSEKGNNITKSDAEKYYVLVLNGSLKREDDNDNCQGLSYYLSWQKEIKDNLNKDTTLYLCGNNPNENSSKKAKVKIKAKDNLDTFIYNYYDDEIFTLTDEDGVTITKNSDDTYNLDYAKKYYIKFSENTCNSTYYMDLYRFNDENNYVYVTLENVKNTENNIIDTIYYDVNNYSNVQKPQYQVDYLRDKIGTSNREAASVLNYNNITPYAIKFKSSNKPIDSIYIYSSSKYCYGTSYSYNNDTRKYKLAGTIECKKYTANDTFFINKYTLRSENKDTENVTMYKLEEETRDTYFRGIEYSNIASEFDDGYYYDYDDDGITYFYRGNIENNYVSFAGLLWRIVRINGNGSIRLILEGDIGGSNWYDYDNFEYYTGYTFGDITYYPLITNNESTIREDIDYNSKYCYSDSFTYDKSKNKYKLSGDIFCEKITNDNYYTKFKDLYTLKQTSKSATSEKMYKLYGRYDNRRHYIYEYDTASSDGLSYMNSSEYCYGSDYKIEKGYYKLSGTIKCDIKLGSGNYKYYKNYYTLKNNNKDYSYRTMYKFMDCPNCTSGSYSRYDTYKYKTYITPIPNYSKSNISNSNAKNKLEEWYESTLTGYDYFITSSTFCNDTTNSSTSSYYGPSYNSYNRLASSSSNRTPTFKCSKNSKYGGKYYEKIGLITADELAFAGASYDAANSNYYLKYSKSFWTMTPYNKNSMFTSNIYENSESYSGSTWYTDSYGDYHEVTTPEEWEACSSGELDCSSGGGYYHAAVNYNIFSSTNIKQSTSQIYSYDGDSSIVLRPVINLNYDTIVYGDGNGTYGNPYVVDTKYEDLLYKQMIGWWY